MFSTFSQHDELHVRQIHEHHWLMPKNKSLAGGRLFRATLYSFCLTSVTSNRGSLENPWWPFLSDSESTAITAHMFRMTIFLCFTTLWIENLGDFSMAVVCGGIHVWIRCASARFDGFDPHGNCFQGSCLSHLWEHWQTILSHLQEYLSLKCSRCCACPSLQLNYSKLLTCTTLFIATRS